MILAGGIPVEIPSRVEDNFQPNLEALSAAVTPRTKAILMGYPNNPTGAVASRETLQEVCEYCREPRFDRHFR